MNGSGDEASTTPPSGLIGSVAHALELLQLFAGGQSIQVSRASRELGLSKSTVHRLLVTLSVYGYVDQDPVTRSYRPGPALAGIGLAAAQSSDLRATARNALVKAAQATGETVHLMLLRGDHVLCLDSIESEQSIRTTSRIGWNLPTSATAGGKALLAELSDAEVETIFPAAMIQSGRQTRLVRRVDLLAELELVRAMGYATNFGEAEDRVGAVAAVLRDRLGQARAALSVTAPLARVSESWARSTGRLLVGIVDEFRGVV